MTRAAFRALGKSDDCLLSIRRLMEPQQNTCRTEYLSQVAAHGSYDGVLSKAAALINDPPPISAVQRIIEYNIDRWCIDYPVEPSFKGLAAAIVDARTHVIRHRTEPPFKLP